MVRVVQEELKADIKQYKAQVVKKLVSFACGLTAPHFFEGQDLEVQMPHSNHQYNDLRRSKILREAKGPKSQNPLSQEVSLAGCRYAHVFVYCVLWLRVWV